MKHPLRKFRERQGLSREELAIRLGVTGMTVYRWEAGQRMPRQKHWPKIKEVANVTPVQMLKHAERVA